MDIESQIAQQIELKLLFQQNEQQYKKRIEQLLHKLQKFIANHTELDIMKNTHLSQLANYINQLRKQKGDEFRLVAPNEGGIVSEMGKQKERENQMLMMEIAKIEKQIQQGKAMKWKCQLGQKYIASKIIDAEDIVNRHKFNLGLLNGNTNKKQLHPCLSFAYTELSDGDIAFNQSYYKIIRHFLSRLANNQSIISRLENTIREKVARTQRTRMSVLRLKSMEQEYHESIASIEKYKNLCEYAKVQLRACLQNATQEIEKKFGIKMDKRIKEMSMVNLAYEKAFISILEVSRRITNKAEIDRVNEHINKQ